MESGSRSSVRYEVEVALGIASLYADEEFIEAVQEEQLDSLLKEYFNNPKKVYVGLVETGAEAYEVKELDLDSEMSQISAAMASINNSVTANTAVSNSALNLNQFRSAVKDNL